MKKIIYFLILFLFLTPVSAFGMEKIFYLSEKNEEISIPIIQKNAKKIDILAPQAYAVKSDLNLYGSLSKELKEVIADNNLKVMPLVVNSKFLQPIIHNLLLSGEAQDKIIASMVELAKENNYIGWQFDFEHINYKDKKSSRDRDRRTHDLKPVRQRPYIGVLGNSGTIFVQSQPTSKILRNLRRREKL